MPATQHSRRQIMAHHGTACRFRPQAQPRTIHTARHACGRRHMRYRRLTTGRGTTDPLHSQRAAASCLPSRAAAAASIVLSGVHPVVAPSRRLCAQRELHPCRLTGATLNRQMNPIDHTHMHAVAHCPWDGTQQHHRQYNNTYMLHDCRHTSKNMPAAQSGIHLPLAKACRLLGSRVPSTNKQAATTTYPGARQDTQHNKTVT